MVFSNFEEEVIELLTPETASVLNVPEGGINIEASCLLNTPEDNISIEKFVLNACEGDTEQTRTQIIESQVELDTEINNMENISSNILKYQEEKSIKK